MKMRPFWLTCLFLATLLAVFTGNATSRVQADDDPVVVSYRLHQKAIFEGECAKKLFALPQWETFCDAFTSACDEALTRELTRDKLQNHLPGPMVDDIVKAADRGISTRSALKTYVKHVQAIVFEIQADFDDDDDIDETLDDIQKLITRQGKELDLDVDGFLAFVLDVNPRPCLAALKYLREGRDYKFLRNVEDGDFILDFDFEHKGQEIEFCCAGLKLDGGYYALVFTNSDDDLLRRCNAMKKSGKLTKDLDVAKEEFVVEKPAFRFIEKAQQRFAPVAATDFLGKIKRFNSVYDEAEGAGRLRWTLEMTSEQDAKSIRDIVAGFIALAQMQAPQGEVSVNDFLASIVVETQGDKINIVLKDHPDLWKLTAFVLEKMTEEINKRK